jgi:hypothetical protein
LVLVLCIACIYISELFSFLLSKTATARGGDCYSPKAKKKKVNSKVVKVTPMTETNSDDEEEG